MTELVEPTYQEESETPTTRRWPCTRVSSAALVATVMELALIASAAMAGLGSMPKGR